jgi:hypothetical protein
MKNFFKKAWGTVRTLWSRISKTVGKMLDDFSMRRVKNMKGYKVVVTPTVSTASTQATAQAQDTVTIQMDELDDWNVVQSNIP